jgi:membrane-bound lytic murein transglycosylase B
VFFTKELEAFLLLAWESGKDPLMLKGSYAGAMGYGQFMPSSYRAYATRFEGEGAPDIWDNPADAISSVGNYLLEHGWHADEDVVVSATVNDPEPGLFEGGLKPTHSVAQLVARGVMPSQPINSDAMATPIGLETQDGMAYWLGLENFYVITRYNHSAMYAMAVWDLSQSIAKARKEKDL